MLTYQQARRAVIEKVSKAMRPLSAITVGVRDALGFVLAQEIVTDREYPPFNRSTRDGYALRGVEAQPGRELRCIGEIKAGDTVDSPLQPGTCIQIMTGAAVPQGADAVVMLEHVQRTGDTIHFERAAQAGQNIVPRSSEAHAGQIILRAGARLGFAEMALAAQVGATQLRCNAKPRVAILSTGDEVVSIDQQPGPIQIRNSKSV